MSITKDIAEKIAENTVYGELFGNDDIYQPEQKPKVYRLDYWENGWKFYCYCFDDSYKIYEIVAKSKSPVNVTRKILLEVRT